MVHTGQGIARALITVAAIAVAVPAFALESTPLVRGGAPLPQFELNLPNLTPPSGTSDNFEIALTAPGSKNAFSFIFSPRPESALELDRASNTMRNVAGLSWNIFNSNRFYGDFGLSGSFLNPATDPMHEALAGGAPASVRGTLSLGYDLGDRQSLMLSFDHTRTPDLSTEHGEFGDNFRLGYGVKF
ncbi:MAG: hypothetical protein KGL11_11815 [Alphaproteobacteria bacterium]|nr:hypothetical protein [Alphaproteobacteria bacterium]